MDTDFVEFLWLQAGGDQFRFAAIVAERCAMLAESDADDGTWLGEATRRAAASRIRRQFDIDPSSG